MSVTHVDSDAQFIEERTKAYSTGKVLVVDFFATWCGPCVRISPIFSELSTKYTNCTFIKVDVDKCQEVAAKEGINAMPTFRCYRAKDGELVKLDEVRGADPSKLEEMIKKHDKDTEGGSSKGGAASGVGQYIDLNPHIDFTKSECLNESDTHTLQGALKMEDGGKLVSDCDEQLLLTVAFQQSVRIYSLLIQAPADGTAPKTVKLFINCTSMDFDSAENGKCVQELELTKNNTTEGVEIPLKFVKFQNVNSLTIFVRDNQGGEEETHVERIALKGQLKDKTDMNEFKRVSGQKGEAHG